MVKYDRLAAVRNLAVTMRARALDAVNAEGWSEEGIRLYASSIQAQEALDAAEQSLEEERDAWAEKKRQVADRCLEPERKRKHDEMWIVDMSSDWGRSAAEAAAVPRLRLEVFFEAKVGEYHAQLIEASASCDSQEQAGSAHPQPPLSSESAAKQQRTGQAGVEAKVGEAQVRPVGFRAQSPAVTGQGGIGNTGGMLQLR